MNKNKKITIILIIIVILAGAFYLYKRNNVGPLSLMTEEDESAGCYTAVLEKDVYALTITKEDGENVSGKLLFKNFEKDSSSGTFEGTYKNRILHGIYSFESEGEKSELEVSFKMINEGFIRGFGDMNEEGNRFLNPKKLTYDTSYIFRPTACLDDSGKFPDGTSPSNPNIVPSITWIWDRTVLSNKKVIIPKKAGVFTLKLGADNIASGTTDCNSFSAKFSAVNDGSIKFENIAATQKACSNSQESVFTGELGDVDKFSFDDKGNLVLGLKGEAGKVLFKKGE